MCVPDQPSNIATQIYDMLITASRSYQNYCQVQVEAALPLLMILSWSLPLSSVMM